MFELRVVFSGIVLTVRHPASEDSAVFMPDCRKLSPDGKPTPMLDDATDGAPHVGYLRFNLANEVRIGDDFPLGDDAEGPSYEVIHRLDREELSFDVKPEEWVPPLGKRILRGAPSASFNEIGTNLAPRPDLFTRTPAKVVLFRALLPGGTFSGDNLGKQWVFPATLQQPQNGGSKSDYHGPFACRETWTRTVDRNDLTIRLKSLDTEVSTSIRLKPDANSRITLKLANLCSHNVLEWPTFKPQRPPVDIDFKWYYNLLTLNKADLFGSELPYPRIDMRMVQPEGDDTCGKGCVSSAFVFESR